ncbi:MAG: hypothetical protein WBC97_02290 [Gemmatimonadales bacterium]
MDSFEQVVAAVLHRQGYWLLPSLKIDLSKGEKRRIGRHSSPRWEIDIVAYDATANHVIAVECKSYMDSSGVQVATFAGSNLLDQARYKMFFEPKLRRVVLAALGRQLVNRGFCRRNPRITLGLAAGKIKGDKKWLKRYFMKRNWHLFTPDDLCLALSEMSDEGYENSVAAMVAKLLLRNTTSLRRDA